MPMAHGFLDQLAWVFPYGKHDFNFRQHSYCLAVQLLLQTGQALGKPSASKFAVIIKSCCNDLIPSHPKSVDHGSSEAVKKLNGNASNANQNADSFLQSNVGNFQEVAISDTDLTVAAKQLLPRFLSHFPQQYMDISMRSLIERTAILSHDKEAMLAGILNPFVGKNGKSLTSILPHLTRAFPHDATVEILLRPRMPLLPSTAGAHFYSEEGAVLEDEDEDMEMDTEHADSVDAPQINTQINAFNVNQSAPHGDAPSAQDNITNHPGLGKSSPPQEDVAPSHHGFATTSSNLMGPVQQSLFSRSDASLSHPPVHIATTLPIEERLVEASVDARDEPLSQSDDESVHLTMQLDTDSESEG